MQTVIVAAAVLHNIAVNMGDVEPPPIPEELDQHQLNVLIENGQIPDINLNNNAVVGGNAARRQFITEYFEQL